MLGRAEEGATPGCPDVGAMPGRPDIGATFGWPEVEAIPGRPGIGAAFGSLEVGAMFDWTGDGWMEACGPGVGRTVPATSNGA